ncbi:hypothetical protein A3A69_00885 [candidate division WWE3 bacterium RIFCSPLOWO2_01_FULL_37_15]|uniref:Uncharacterized protein n=1 Tax=candidate division WWE3 bacterium RIFCSPLOWO2_01_FULL_37_15 TaxID=1802622 RepID=A0A1F4UT82_UNCKA|nr:MAG: hypothetical protein A3A69_00885 [candidate division WWE3 bacterium RIFCSPLOWO2_01_FULL_37_15]
MSNLLSRINEKTDKTTPSNLLKLGVLIFIIFVPIGLLLGNLISLSLNIPETNNVTPVNNNIDTSKETYYEGTVTYVNPNMYPNDEITYVLKDDDGNDVILLKSYDQKLAVAEGHKAKVYGSVMKSSNESNTILVVNKVVIVNVSN